MLIAHILIQVQVCTCHYINVQLLLICCSPSCRFDAVLQEARVRTGREKRRLKRENKNRLTNLDSSMYL